MARTNRQISDSSHLQPLPFSVEKCIFLNQIKSNIKFCLALVKNTIHASFRLLINSNWPEMKTTDSTYTIPILSFLSFSLLPLKRLRVSIHSSLCDQHRTGDPAFTGPDSNESKLHKDKSSYTVRSENVLNP